MRGGGGSDFSEPERRWNCTLLDGLLTLKSPRHWPVWPQKNVRLKEKAVSRKQKTCR
jgi:hypothetical protein